MNDFAQNLWVFEPFSKMVVYLSHQFYVPIENDNRFLNDSIFIYFFLPTRLFVDIIGECFTTTQFRNIKNKKISTFEFQSDVGNGMETHLILLNCFSLEIFKIY